MGGSRRERVGARRHRLAAAAQPFDEALLLLARGAGLLLALGFRTGAGRPLRVCHAAKLLGSVQSEPAVEPPALELEGPVDADDGMRAEVPSRGGDVAHV